MKETKYKVWDNNTKKWLTDFDEIFINDEGIVFREIQNAYTEWDRLWVSWWRLGCCL